MSKIIKLLGIFIMLINFEAVAKKSNFATANNAADVVKQLKHLPKDSVIFFDIDDTIITPASKTFRSAPHNQLIDDIKKNKDQYHNYHEIVSNWRLQRKVMLLDQNWPNALAALKEKFPVYGLTKMDAGKFGNIKSMEQWRYQELKSLKVEFSENHDIPHESREHGAFDHGIFYTGAFSKSKTLEQYVSYFPVQTIVLIDDRLDHLEDVQKFCLKHSIGFVGILFKGLEQLNESPDPAIADFQKHHLINNAEWLEDDVAAKRLARLK